MTIRKLIKRLLDAVDEAQDLEDNVLDSYTNLSTPVLVYIDDDFPGSVASCPAYRVERVTESGDLVISRLPG